MTLLTSPVGDIVWMAAHTPHEDKKTGKKTYSVRLAIDPSTDTDGFLAAVTKLNKKKVVTAKSYSGESEKLQEILATGKVLIEARSQFAPTVSDAQGNKLEEAPMFFAESTGKARMIVQPYTSDKGGTINLIEIVLYEINTPESETSGESREEQLARIRAQLREAARQE